MILRSLVVRAPNWLGDCIMSLPTVDALRHALPQTRLLVACREHLAACYAVHPGVAEIIPCPPHGFGHALAFWRTARALRPRQIDAGLLLTNSFSSALWLWLAGIKERIGFARDGRSALLTWPVPVNANILAAHQSEYYLHLAAQLGAAAELRLPSLSVPHEGKADAEALRARLGVKMPYAVVAPASAYGEVKDWPAEHFGRLVARILSAKAWDVLLVGSSDQQPICERIAAMAQKASGGKGGKVHAIAGSTSLPTLFGILSQAVLFVGNDSGGAHAAAALGVATVVIFGITEPGRTRPLGKRVAIIGEGGYVMPDLKSHRIRCAAREALAHISPEEVWDEMQRLLTTSNNCN